MMLSMNIGSAASSRTEDCAPGRGSGVDPPHNCNQGAARQAYFGQGACAAPSRLPSQAIIGGPRRTEDANFGEE